MSQITNAQLPAGFTTLEQLAVYLGSVLSEVYPSDKYLLNSSTSEKIAERAIVRTADGQDFFVARFAIPLNSTYLTPTLPLWTHAKEVSNTAIPARFKA